MKKSLHSLSLNKKIISNLSTSATNKILGGGSNTCCDYSCSCDTVDTDLTADCYIR